MQQLIDLSLGSVARLLALFYELPVVGGSFGLAIILLTVTVMVVLMPLTLKATKSTIKMTQLQPKLKELQKKYKDDKQTLNTEMMALYQREGVNPVGGCLPMLAQLPVFLILFNVLRGLTRRVEGKPFFSVADHARDLAGRAAAVDPRSFDPQYISEESKMYQDLTDGRTSMDFGPFDLANSAWEVMQSNFVTALPYLALIGFVIATSYYQQRQISARRNSDEPLTPQMQTQQQLIKILPLMSGAWSFVFPAGLVLYWATSNLFRIGQQGYITHSLYKGEGAGAQMLRDQAERRKADAEGDEGEAGGEGGSGVESDDTEAERVAPATVAAPETNGDGAAAASDREKRWAERRAQKAKVQARRSASSGSGSKGSAASSRLTPKGTKPTSSKKKRKR